MTAIKLYEFNYYMDCIQARVTLNKFNILINKKIKNYGKMMSRNC